MFSSSIAVCVCQVFLYRVCNQIHFSTMVASIEDDIVDSLPDSNFSKEFYAKYEPKDILGRYVCI